MEKQEKDVIVSEMLARINKIISYYNVSLRKFSLSIGVFYNTMQNLFYRNSDVSHSILYNIIKNYPLINPEWLLTGRGEMFRDNSLQETTKELAKTMLQNKELKQELEDAEKQIASLQRIVEQLSGLLAKSKAS